jgi:hypothetical protein
VVLLLGCLALAAHAVWDHVERRRLVAEIDAVLQSGAPVDAPSGVQQPPAVHLAAAAVLSYGLPRMPGPVTPAASTPDAAVDAATDVDQLLDEGRLALLLADEAARHPDASIDAAPDFSYRAAGLSRLHHLVAVRTREEARRGRAAEAVASTIVGLRIRGAAHTPFFATVPDDVGFVLSHVQPDDAALSAWAATLRDVEVDDFVVHTVEAARGRFIANAWRAFYGPSPSTLHHQTLPRRGVLPWLWRPWFSRQFAADLREWAAAIEVASRTPADRAPFITDLEARRRAEGPRRMLVPGRWFMGMPPTGAWDALLDAARRDTLAIDRAARAALAVERFRRAEQGHLPDTLDALVPRFVEALPRDPFSDGPVRYRQTPDGYVVYSIGTNLRDDQGGLTVPPPVRGPTGMPYRLASPDVGVAVRVR